MRIRQRLLFLSLLAIGPLFWAAASNAQTTDSSWPREIDSSLGRIIIYQPQPDSLEGNVLTGRAAVSLQAVNEKEPVFGAVWFRSQVSVDRDAGIVTIEKTQILRAKFPDAKPEDVQKFSDAVETEVPKWDLVVSLKQLEASLAVSEQERTSTENLKTDPPQIIFSRTPAVLVTFDGEPETRPIENMPYERVVNTAFLIIKDKNSGNFYLSNGQTWYTSKNPKGPWNTISNPPAEIKKLVPPDPESQPDNGPAAKIITATEPTELIVTEGAPKWTPLPGNEILYASNTESTLVKEIATNKYYALLSGRWFSSPSLDGPWAYERGDQLPRSFKQIAPASPIGDALASVPGTDQAEDAVMDSQIPQTAAIKRSEAKVEVTYDGAPQFQQIPSTDVQYAVNTDSSVLKIGDRYYVCDNAVWFAGVTPNGPWVVSDRVPDSVKSIPPSSPVYNVRYVTVYESTPDIVYVGYTPGYVGSYRYYGSVVYGTGWIYRPWIGPVYYYPRPFTWGFHVIYNPWNGGWGFALGYSTSFINVSIGWGARYYRRPPYWSGGWWGPGGYRPIYRPLPGYRPHYRPPPNAAVIRPGRPRPTPLPGKPRPSTRDNIYKRPGNVDRVTRDVPSTRPVPKPATKLPNNVYTDKDGNVFRKDKAGNWEQRDKGNWTKPAPKPGSPETKPTNPATRPSIKPAPTNPQPKPSAPISRPAPRPTNPQTKPVAPAPRPSPKPSTETPQTRPSMPKTRPAPAPEGLDRDAAARARGAERSAPSSRTRAPAKKPAPKNKQ